MNKRPVLLKYDGDSCTFFGLACDVQKIINIRRCFRHESHSERFPRDEKGTKPIRVGVRNADSSKEIANNTAPHSSATLLRRNVAVATGSYSRLWTKA